MCGGDSAYPFCDVNRGRLCLDRTSNTSTCKYIQVLDVSLYVYWKSVFLAFFRQCQPGVLLLDAAKQLKMVSVCQVVRSDVFSAVRQTLRAVVLRESGIHYTFWHEEKSSFFKTWRHPNNFSSQWGSRRRYLKDVTNLKEHMPNVNKVRYFSNF